MRCSLLTLSSYLDDELSSDRRSEVDAHLVGCQRCRNGAGYLEEEVARIGALARVHVPDQGAYTLMQQLGLIGPEEVIPARHSPTVALHRDDTPPWLRGGSSRAALPWVPPSKVDDLAGAGERNQPALPFSDVPLHQMSSRGSTAAPPPTAERELPEVDDIEAEVELDGRAFYDSGTGIESRAGSVPEPQVAQIPAAETAQVSAPEPSGLTDLTQSPALPHGGFVGPDLAGLKPEPTPDADDLPAVAFSATQPPGATEPPAPTIPVHLAPEPPPAAGELGAQDWRAWLPDPPETPTTVPAATHGVASPPPPPAADVLEPSPNASPGIEDLDDDAWNWAPRDHEQPRRDGRAASAEPVGQAWHPGPIMPAQPVDGSLDPLIDPLIARATGPPRPVRSSAISRIRDQIALRLALARRRPRGDDEVQIVSGHGAPERSVPQRRTSRRIRPDDSRRTAPRAIESGGPIIAAARSHVGFAAPERRDQAATSRPRFDPAPGGDRPTAAPLGGFPEDALRGSGRHARGLSFRRSPLANPQLRRAGEILAALGASAVERGRVVIAHPRQRLIAAGAVIALILVIFLTFHRSSDAPSAASRQPQATAASSSSAAASAPSRATPAGSGQSTPAATTPPAAAPAIPKAQTYGDGGQGWQIQHLRYGIHPGDYRIVFDLAAAGAGATGSPTATISFTDPQTMLVTYSGVVPPGSAGTPTPGGVVTSVTETKGSGGQEVFKFSLAHPVTVAGQYLRNPLRLVIDLRS